MNNKSVLRVAVLSESSKNRDENEYVDYNDEFFDISIDYIQGIANELGLKTEVISYPSIRKIYSAVLSGEVDLASGFTRTDKREHHFLFTDAMYTSTISVGYRNTDKVLEKEVELNWVCVSDTIYCDLLESRGYLHIKKVNCFLEAIRSLNEGESDAILDSYVSLIEYLNDTNLVMGKVYTPIWAKPIHVASFTRADNQLLVGIINKILNREKLGLTKYTIVSGSPYHQIDKMNAIVQSNQQFKKPIRFTLEDDIYPMFYRTSSGYTTGYVLDILNLLESRSNLSFEYVPLAKGETPEKLISEGKVDLLPVIVNETRDVNQVWSTKPYLKLKFVSMELKKGVDPSVEKVGVLLAGQHEENYMDSLNESNFGEHVEYFTDFMKLVVALDENKIQRAFVSENLVDIIIAQQIDQRFIVNSDVYRSVNLSMGVASNNRLLADVLNGTFMALNDYELKTIKRNYTMFNVSYGYEKTGVTKIIIAAIFVFFFLIFLGGWGWKNLSKKIYHSKKEAQHTKNELDLLQGIIDGLPTQVFIHDGNNHLLMTNCEEFVSGNCTKCKMRSKTGRSDLLVENAREIQHVIQNNDVIDRVTEIKNCHLQMKSVHLYRKCIVNNLGKTPLVLTAISDVTKQKEQQAELMNATEMAKGAVVAREQFLASMSHELRTPIAGMSGLIEMLKMQLKESESKLILDNIAAATHNLHMLVNDILDFSKMEANQLQLDLNKTCLIRDICEVLRTHHVAANKKDLYFEIEFEPTNINEVEIDNLRLNQILHNILSNAIKFTSRGGVTVQVNIHQSKINVNVADTGAGMTEDQKLKVFDPFVQADSSISRKYGGTGLGLAIVKDLVHLMGGELSIKSIIGIGTRVNFWLPLQVSSYFSQKLSSMNAVYSGDGNHIRQWLEIWTGECCLDKVIDVEVYHNGERKLTNSVHDILLCQSVSDFKRTDRKITKITESPLYPDLLLDTLFSIHSGDSEKTSYDLSQFIGNVLIAEDNQINQFLIRKQLTSLGVNVKIVSDGEAAFKLLQQHHQDFDLLFTDCHMPNMDGFELTNKIRTELPQFNGKPIIGCTAADARAKSNCSYNYEFDDILYKPYGIDKMARILSQHLPISSNHTKGKSIEGTEEYWWEKFSDDEKEVMINIFLKSMSEDLEKLKKLQSKNQGDHNLIREVAHRIKGGAMSININDISEPAERLEEASVCRDDNLDFHMSKLISVISKYIQKTEQWSTNNDNQIP
ncbi:transporter substrate-binding domain-containing protein [Photobacterium sp. 1_MG-2023]|nr:transporter substrate-binding domain-containing protein [Photobacterium sp. 1_MG-2023]